jgi:hypothetical protein
MVATVSVYFDFGGLDGAPGTEQDIDALGPPTLRFKAADDATIDANDKLVIPAAGTIYSYWKQCYLYCDDADSHTLSNFKLYSDGNNGLGVGVDVYVGLQFPTKTNASNAGYEVADSQTELVAGHGGITTSASVFDYTSGAPLTISCGEAGSVIDDTGETTKYFVLQMNVASTASAGDTPNETLTLAYDEA